LGKLSKINIGTEQIKHRRDILPKLFAAGTFIILIAMVVSRVITLKRNGVEAMNFGKLDKSDFLIPPFALFYFYVVFANVFKLPTFTRQTLFDSKAIAWIGVVFCLAGLGIFLWSIISFGRSFRVGIDVENPDQLITNRIFAFTRNPIYVAFGLVLIGQFLVFPNWILLIYLAAAFWLFHRQVLREEEFLVQHYKQEFLEYCQRVRRYI